MIYAIEAVGLGLVKVGRAKDPKDRISVLKTGCPAPIKLIAAVDWPDAYEGRIHRAFGVFRENGEWFRAEGEFLEFLQSMQDMPKERAHEILNERIPLNDAPRTRKARADGVLPPHNRWARDKYNAYQREYMRKRRGRIIQKTC